MRAPAPQGKASPGLPPDEPYHAACLAGLAEWSEMEEPELGFAP